MVLSNGLGEYLGESAEVVRNSGLGVSLGDVGEGDDDDDDGGTDGSAVTAVTSSESM